MKIYKIKVLTSVVLHNGTEDIEYKDKEVFAVKSTGDGMQFFWEADADSYGAWFLSDGDYEIIDELNLELAFDDKNVPESKTYEEHKKEVDEFAALEGVLSALSKNAKNIEFK